MGSGGIAAAILGIAIYLIATSWTSDDVKTSVEYEDLPMYLKQWREMGQTTRINGNQMFYVYKKCSNKKVKNPPTFAIVHGFPSSSFDYHKVIDDLTKHGNVIANDHIGFGFSDIPIQNFTYSLSEAAENLLAVWRHVGIKNAHVISHDMGDSIITEILARRYRKMLPSDFDHFFQSVTFTNGGMRFDMINFRVSQYILMYPSVGMPLSLLGHKLGVTERFFKKQILSIWSPYAENMEERDRDIHDLYLLNAYKNKLLYGYKLCYYLWDRSRFEFRWFDALRHLDIPSRFIWSDSDTVSPVAIPKSFKDMVPNFKLTLVKNGGHFWMLENPKRWIEEAIEVLK